MDTRVVRVGILGDFDRAKHSHWATEAALFHAAARLELNVQPRWLATPSLMAADGLRQLDDVHGVWGAPGSPFESFDGMLRGIQHAREKNLPYLGTCAGFQYALVEFTRNVLGVADANSAENDPEGANIVITPVACEAPRANTPRLLGKSKVHPVVGTRLAQLCGERDLDAEFFCSFETNASFEPRWREAGLHAAARGSSHELRALELPAHRFFIATLFQPQLTSAFETPHPLVEGFLRASATSP